MSPSYPESGTKYGRRSVATWRLVIGLVIGTATATGSETSHAQNDARQMNISSTPVGMTPEGQEVTQFSLVNTAGHRIVVMTWGATLMDVVVPDSTGKFANVNLKFDSLKRYLEPHPFFGSTVGRFCNRIGNARFEIDGRTHDLTANHGKHQLHGGVKSFTFQNWHAEPYRDDDSVGVVFRLVSPDGQEGFPGTVTATADYRWNNASELTITFSAVTDAATHVNMTNHSYWNLAGAGGGTALEHVAMIQADHALEVDADLIPTGRIHGLDGHPLDLRTPRPLGDRVERFPATKGYDHCYVVRGEPGTLRPAARVVDPGSGRTLEIETTQPGVQLYTANHLAGDDSSAGNAAHDAFCLETQHYPDSPNRPEFPSTLLRPGDKMTEVTLYRFGVQ